MKKNFAKVLFFFFVLLAASPVLAAQVQLPGKNIPQFVDPLPGLHAIIAGNNEITLNMTEFQTSVMPTGFVPASGVPYTGTWVWGYLEQGQTDINSYIGPVIVASRGTPTQIRFVNDLGSALASKLPFWMAASDQTLHWADPLGDGMSTAHYMDSIPAVPHLHGGEVPPVLDGGPDAWFTSDGNYHGPSYYTRPGAGAAGNEAVYRYPNTQEAASIWFHDHALGITRLNVYAGLAGAYLITDPDNPPPANLPGPADIIPLVIQDRMFDTEGQLFFPDTGINAEHPYWIPEFVGDTIVVNGEVWPYVSVEPRRYRFLIINGSNARTYEMFLVNQVTDAMGPAIYQIGTDGGYLDAPVKIDPNAPDGQLQKLTIMPGERADIIIDFGSVAGQTLVLRNTGRTPFPKGESPHGATIGRIIQIRVNAAPVADGSYDPATGAPLRSPMVRLVNPAAGTLAVAADKTRQLTLNEVMGPGGPLEVLVNNTKWGAAISEHPAEGETEVWEVVNLTADAHPIHTHLTQFQILNRQGFNVSKYNAAYAAAFPGGAYIPAYGPPLDYNTGNPRAQGGNPDVAPFLQGPAMPPAANEAGWKDTAIMYPGQITRIAVRYAPTSKDPVADAAAMYYPFDPSALDGGFVWHCHIIDHEDNEMMRPYAVVSDGEAERSYIQGADY